MVELSHDSRPIIGRGPPLTAYFLALAAISVGLMLADQRYHQIDRIREALLAYAKGLLLVPEASAVTMTAVDRYGFDLAISTPRGPKAARLAFDAPLTTTDEVRKAMVALVKRARAPT